LPDFHFGEPDSSTKFREFSNASYTGSPAYVLGSWKPYFGSGTGVPSRRLNLREEESAEPGRSGMAEVMRF
jgi:hypothetical protein